MSAETHAKLRRAQDLLRHAVPDGDPAAILDRALTVLLQQLERTKYAAKASTTFRTAGAPPPATTGRASETHRRVGPERSDVRADHAIVSPDRSVGRGDISIRTSDSPKGRSRAIPAAVRRAVWTRDGGRCSYVGLSGRCRETGRLEFHHRVPFAGGGESSVENVTILCTAHNAMLADQDFPMDAESVASSAPQNDAQQSGSGNCLRGQSPR